MRALILLSVLITATAQADILEETRTQNVDQPSVHLDCTLKNSSKAMFSAYSRVIIKTEFVDDGPGAYAFDDKNTPVENLSLDDFSEHPGMKLRVFVLKKFDENSITNLIVQYSKIDGKVQASAVLTTNGKSFPGVVSNQEMNCDYQGKLAIND